MGAMLDMMQRMMGKTPGKKKDGKKPGSEAGDGLKGDSDAANDHIAGKANRTKDPVRRVPKSAGRVGDNLPQEFQRALDAYNQRKP